MPRINKLIITFLFATVFALSSCSSVTKVHVIEQDRIKLELNVRKPLKLSSVKWKLYNIDGAIMYSLNRHNFDNLSTNIQRIQNRLYLNMTDINSYRSYYETNN